MCARFPHKGEFKLSKNETLEFSNPKPTLFAGMLDSEGKEFKVHLKIKEKDLIKDDTYLDEAITIPWANHDQDHDFVAKVQPSSSLHFEDFDWLIDLVLPMVLPVVLLLLLLLLLFSFQQDKKVSFNVRILMVERTNW